MKRPNTQTMVLGHPVITGCVVVGGGICGLAGWSAGGGGCWVTLMSICIVAAVAKMNERASAYKRWKGEWDALAEPGTLKPKMGLRGFVEWLVAGMIVVLIFTAIGGSKPALGFLILLTCLTFAVMLIRWVWRRFFRRSHSAVRQHVSIIAKSIIATPALETAYRRLPAHCQRMMAGGSR